ncbi:hypothetical protein [Allostreptomyces psammosilenae]|uniref:Lipoprotein n=1 Tax=Allostreptomyces psammosilenae TaxID=1892865 RepID=A0A852ZR21_9ACTN|nr:hypothetical protein [Allostreptomyces psammosilenae]NYI04829.1 hypothetical protein [Allostreptomyces psammosilenae]
MPGPPRHASVAAVALAASLALTACGGLDQRRQAAAEAATAFAVALRAGDGPAACALLAPGTTEELESEAEAPCATALPEEELPVPADPAVTVRRVDVHGRAARVVLADDTLFLASFDAGWRVTAAGCQPRRPDRPYDCRIKAG